MAKDGGPTLTEAVDEAGRPVVKVRWLEPVEVEFPSRFLADNFLAMMRASGRSVSYDDGACQACSAHHAGRHGCPSCGADLSLRVAPAAGRSLERPPTVLPGPDQFLIPREQHQIRQETAEKARLQVLAEQARGRVEFGGDLFAETGTAATV